MIVRKLPRNIIKKDKKCIINIQNIRNIRKGKAIDEYCSILDVDIYSVKF